MMAWHSNAMLKDLASEPIEYSEFPECGWFKVQMVRRGPYVPARIWLHQEVDPETGELACDERFVCEVNSQEKDVAWWWSKMCRHPISQAEFNYLIAKREWAEEHSPHEPAVNPSQPVDWLKVSTGKLF
jgi:hypothetical protein